MGTAVNQMVLKKAQADEEIRKPLNAMEIYNNKIIQENIQLKDRLEHTLRELNLYKEREMEAFSIGDQLNDGIYLMNPEGTIISVNKAFRNMTGISEKEIVGKNIEVLEEKKIATNNVESVVKEKKKISSLTILNQQKIVVTANPIFNSHGEVTQILTVMRDVTELVKMHEQLEYSEKLTKKYRDELNYLRVREAQKCGLLGESPSIHQIRRVIFQVAQSDVTVLITGETGVGKEIIANEIFKNSLRKENPFIKINCAAIPENLLESELFGYEKGSFTGALNKEKLGLFELANTGTILLDEIGEMPLNLQSKLLRVLQERELIRIGGTKPIKLDVRVIASTNQNLEEQVSKGKFRQDLYYRLKVVPIEIPPLRLRQDDIPILINHFIKKYNDKYKQNKRVDISAMQVLQMYEWPGNVRELQNIIEQLIVIVNESLITKDDILTIIDNKKLSPAYFDKSKLTLKEAVNFVEKQMIENALKNYGSTHKAARVLGVSQPTVLRKAKELGLKTGS